MCYGMGSRRLRLKRGQELHEDPGYGGKGIRKYLFASATPKIICSHVKEKAEMSSLFVHEEDERVPLTSCVVYPGPSLEQAYFLNLHMDNRKIFRALLKLATTYLQKKPPPGVEIKSEDSEEKKTVYGVWRMLLDETEKIAKARLAAAEVFSQQISENAKNVRANKLHVAKKCFDNLRRIQDEVQQCVQEVDKTKKLYFEEEHMAHEARDKAHDAEEKLKKKKGRIFQSITSLQKSSQKFSSRREACDIQSTKARNDYILALVAANAHQSRFYETDLPDILQSLDCDVSEKVKDYIQLMSRTELLTVTACNSSFSRILEDANHVRTICTEHHADICLSKEAKKWSSAYMKECRTLRDANKELNRLLGQIAKGERTMESSTGEQEDVEQKLEDIRNSIRKAETSKLKAEARLEALREGGVNVDEFLNSLDIDSLQIEDLSRKGSTASRGSRKSSRSDVRAPSVMHDDVTYAGGRFCH
ncbi:hypothetical protein HPB51_012964 [Rhipicephalus microplus]|uniref:F-BAR domain-containing protein n=1 Tax=Rhipicephalus microplus TaxID=6941 RepID=A0A9J6F211_RHIMP|nr:hypothetical protein HPB51_012964 [Rhipicephalus microplus]